LFIAQQLLLLLLVCYRLPKKQFGNSVPKCALAFHGVVSSDGEPEKLVYESLSLAASNLPASLPRSRLDESLYTLNLPLHSSNLTSRCCLRNLPLAFLDLPGRRSLSAAAASSTIMVMTMAHEHDGAS